MDGILQRNIKLKPLLFNFNELRITSNGDSEGIIVLLFCVEKGYNNLLSDSQFYLCKYLHIDTIPTRLLLKNIVRRKRDGSLISKYKTNNPQSYMRNNKVLKYACKPIYKQQLAYLLSFRPIGDDTNSIPTEYIENINQFKANPLITISDNKIHFITENN